MVFETWQEGNVRKQQSILYIYIYIPPEVLFGSEVLCSDPQQLVTKSRCKQGVEWTTFKHETGPGLCELNLYCPTQTITTKNI